jgi:hypothetical protein
MNRILTIGAMISAVVGVLAPIAGATSQSGRPDDRAGLIGVGAAQTEAQPTPDLIERAAARIVSAQPDLIERAALRSTAQSLRPDDRAGARGRGALTAVSLTAVPRTDDGFAWNDAAVGAVAMLGIVLLGAAATFAIRRREHLALR